MLVSFDLRNIRNKVIYYASIATVPKSNAAFHKLGITKTLLPFEQRYVANDQSAKRLPLRVLIMISS